MWESIRMLRWLGFMFFTGGAAILATWLADRPGTVKIEWEGWGVDTTVGVVLVLIAIFSIAVSLVYQGFLLLRRMPGKISASWRNSRREKGYKALTRGMVAVAAGDAGEARRNADRVSQILNDPPLSMLLSAQAAQLNGDEEAAEQFFKEMTKTKDTAFLGFRGLFNQAMKRKDYKVAFELASKAYQGNPKSSWVAEAFLKLQMRHGIWREAINTHNDMLRNNLLNSKEANHFQSALYYQLAIQSLDSGDKLSAKTDLKASIKKNPGFVPGIVELAKLFLVDGKKQKVAKLIEKAWSINPHPDLAKLYGKTCGSGEKIDQLKHFEKLIIRNSDHLESRIVKARALINAKFWGEARKVLIKETGELVDQDFRAYCMLAELEEKEHGDHKASRKWLDAANKIPQGPLWICRNCGNAVPEWSSFCASCESFNAFVWQHPRHISSNSNGIPLAKNLFTEQKENEAADIEAAQTFSSDNAVTEKNKEQNDQQNAR